MAAKLSARAGQLNIVVEQGTDLEPVFTWKDSAGNPVDLTSYNAVLQVREEVGSTVVLFEMSVANGRIILGGVAGTIQLIFSNMQNTPWYDPETETGWLTGQYHLELTDSFGKKRRLLKGTIEVDPEIVR